MVEGGVTIRDFASYSSGGATCTSGDHAAHRCPVPKRLSAGPKASSSGLVVGRTGAPTSYRGLSRHRVNSHVRGSAQRDRPGRATIVCTISVNVCAYNSAIQRG